MITQDIQELKSMVTGELIFDTPATVKITPHSELFRAYGVANIDDTLYAMDGEGNWHEIQPNQGNVEYVVNSLLQRLKLIKYEANV